MNVSCPASCYSSQIIKLHSLHLPTLLLSPFLSPALLSLSLLSSHPLPPLKLLTLSLNSSHFSLLSESLPLSPKFTQYCCSFNFSESDLTLTTGYRNILKHL
ncbi:hypothetical protein CEXT_142551 [Caerostris extrusa]|uniref:Uncharacterized protein n=1 Tax=Caerostris extrusa TaxID=172846 RepID=A0AAV4PSI8_CAEEX|nr:hypothetical protein CEXT_142551 [Caerostris extrusa]